MDKIQLKIFTPQELNHSSYIQTGLFELEKEGFLKTKVVLSIKKRLGTIKIFESNIEITKQPHQKTSLYKLKNKNKKILFATDLYDDSRTFSLYALENCNYIFKRNYEQKIIDKLPVDYQQKIFPLGLSFRVDTRNRKGKYTFAVGLFIANFLISIKYDRMLFKRLFQSVLDQRLHWKESKKNMFIDNYEKNILSTENFILFQTRCFPYETDQDVKQIHKQRYDITLLLRNKFKDIFKGGIIPSAIANKNYSAALSNIPSEPMQYLQAVKNSKIVIYTRGLVNSPAWKMAEYLSQGKVIIAENLTAELPIPLQNGKEVLFFENNDELISQIETCLNNEKLCVDLSNNAKKYFDDNVHPKINMKRIINFMLSHNQ